MLCLGRQCKNSAVGHPVSVLRVADLLGGVENNPEHTSFSHFLASLRYMVASQEDFRVLMVRKEG